MQEGILKVAPIIRSAGGQVVGRTRLQKIAYLLSLIGRLEGFSFRYKHYGPYSEDFANAVLYARTQRLIREDFETSSWGGEYSIYTVQSDGATIEGEALELARLAAQADAVELELVATAIFLKKQGFSNAWSEVADRKPDKANKVQSAKALLIKLKKVAPSLPSVE